VCTSIAYNSILEYVKENPGKTVTEIADSLRMKIRNTRSYLHRMCEDEITFISGQKLVGSSARLANTYEFGTTPDCSEVTIIWSHTYEPVNYVPDPLTSALFAHFEH
jgi:predicted transcriptional regulator